MEAKCELFETQTYTHFLEHRGARSMGKKFDSSASALTVAEDVKLQVTDLDSRKVDEHYNGELKQHDGEAVIMTQLGYSDLNVA